MFKNCFIDNWLKIENCKLWIMLVIPAINVYSKEELIAECGASFLCGYTGIINDTIENQTAYIEHWRKQLATDKKLVISAAAQAQKAVDFILDRRADREEAA